MIDIRAETEFRADATFTVGKRTFYVICEVTSMKGPGGRAFGRMVSPTALLVAEGELLYSASLTGKNMDVEEALGLVPSLREKVRPVSASTGVE